MEYFLSLLKIIVLLAVLAGISYFLVKKNKQANRTRKSEN
ncbi:TPA: flagellar motor switch protein FliN, partial [Listeria monocytogenes]|nr:flagellar motor switch protein FliN [Listeria monocytogenes]